MAISIGPSWSKYTKGSVATIMRLERKRLLVGPCQRPHRITPAFLMVLFMPVVTSDRAYAGDRVQPSSFHASLGRSVQIDQACLETLTRSGSDVEPSTASYQCFVVPGEDPAIGDGQKVGDGKEEVSFATLMQAISGLQRALVKQEIADNPVRTAALQNNLGLALALLGDLQSDETIQTEAVRTLRAALVSAEGHQDKALFGMTQRNLSFALMSLAVMTNNREHADEAIDLYVLAQGTLNELDDEDRAALTRDQPAPVTTAPSSPVPDRPDASAEHAEDDNQTPSVDDEPSEFEAASDFELSLYGSIKVAALVGRDDVLKDGGSGYGHLLNVEPEVEINASYETGLGLNYSANISLDTDVISESTGSLQFWGGFGELRLGQDSGAEDDMYIGGGDIQAGTGGIDGDAANLVDVGLTGSDDAPNVSYFTPRVSGFQLGASFTPETPENPVNFGGDVDDDDAEERFEDHIGVGINWTRDVNNADIIASAVGSFGKATIGDDDLSSYSVGASVEFGPYQAGAGYTAETSFNDRDLLNVGVTRSFDPWLGEYGDINVGAGVAFVFPENAADSTVWALSADMGLASGLRLLGDIAYNSRDVQTTSGDEESFSGVLAIEMYY